MVAAVYLVGGAVRDDLLGLTQKERDWVVVGGAPEELLAQGYRQVGASFPVFLHPDTGEEYALARTERKQGHGYHGFSVDFHPGVTLEEDLARRDLTINAMARDENGRLIDPHNGKKDLDERVLRHVSPAFREDPLRVLRVARFAARFAPQEFRVHDSTMELMREICESGELEYLAAERIWTEVASAMATAEPGVFVEVLRECGALATLLPEVNTLFGIPQPEKYHPEIDTGVHVLMTMNVAARSARSPEVVFALLMHDLGKGLTPESEWPSHVGHERRGVPLVERVCERLKAPNAFRDLAIKVAGLHLRCHRLRETGPAGVLLSSRLRSRLSWQKRSGKPSLSASRAPGNRIECGSGCSCPGSGHRGPGRDRDRENAAPGQNKRYSRCRRSCKLKPLSGSSSPRPSPIT
jgi:tRNA nucleotidyltransferase (CCA-adding enzyme)